MSSSMEMWDDALPFCGVVADIKCKWFKFNRARKATAR